MADLNLFQRRVVAAYQGRRRRIALRAGWGAGKSYALGWLARDAGERGNSVMWVTDTGPHIDTIIQPVAERLLAPCGWRYIGDKRVWRKNSVDIWLRSYFRPSTKAAESNSAEGSNVGLVLLDERVSRESIVETPAGPRRIGDLVAEGYRGLVLGFDHATCRPAWTPVLATMAYADERPSYRFEWNGGSLECTGNHPIWLDGIGYVPASNVFEGTSRVRQDTQHEADDPGDIARGRHADDPEGLHQTAVRLQSQLEAGGVRRAEGDAARFCRLPWVSTTEDAAPAPVFGWLPHEAQVAQGERPQSRKADRPNGASAVHDLREAVRAEAEGRGLHMLRRMPTGEVEAVPLRVAAAIEPLRGACDLTTGTANFFADGVLVHNCQMWANDEPMKKLFGRSRIGPEPPAIVMAGLPIYNAWWEESAKALGRAGAIIYGTSYDNPLLRQEWFDDAFDTLGQVEYEAMLLNKPRPPIGQVYSSWSPDPFPSGNVLNGWHYDRSMQTVLAIDFGQNHPAVLVLAWDPACEAWVICGEVNPREPYTTVPQLAQQILAVAWPRHLEHMAPTGEDAPRFFFDDVVADPAGRQRRRDARTGDYSDSDLEILSEMPRSISGSGEGIGFAPRILLGKGAEIADRLDPRSGILRTNMAFARKAILCCGEVWKRGKDLPGKARSFAKSVLGFRYGPTGQPIRTEGHDHILDALRYWVRDEESGLWGVHPLDTRSPGMVSAYASNFEDSGGWGVPLF